MKSKIVFLIIICFYNIVEANDNYKNITSDTLFNKSYKELSSLIYSDSIGLDMCKKYAFAYLNKAKKDTSDYKVAVAYHHLSQIGNRENNTTKQLQYLDSIIEYSKNLNLKKYPEFAYYIKGIIYYEKADYKNSLESYVKSYNIAKEKNNIKLIFNSKHGIGALKTITGNNKEALKIFKECKEYLKKRELNDNQYFEDYLAILTGLSDSYRKNKLLDSSSYINKLGIKAAYSYDSDSFKAFFTLSEGINLNYRKNYNISNDSINSAMLFLNKLKDTANMAFANFYKAKNYIGLGKEEKAILYLKKVDTIYKNINFINQDVRENYELLINYYKKKDDIKNQLLYIKRLIYVDSVLYSNDKYLSVNIVKKYETQELLNEKEELIKKTSRNNNIFKTILIIITISSFVIIISLLYNYRKNKRYQKKFEELIKINNERISTDLTKTNNVIPTKTNLEIPKEISSQIITNLEKFKKEKGYLSPNLTIAFLAKDIGTNTKYLSKVINYYEKKSFSNYINDLRIDNIIDELKNDPILRKYTISAISEKAGFKNSQSFSQAFNKKTGIYPSLFIKKVDNHIKKS